MPPKKETTEDKEKKRDIHRARYIQQQLNEATRKEFMQYLPIKQTPAGRAVDFIQASIKESEKNIEKQMKRKRPLYGQSIHTMKFSQQVLQEQKRKKIKFEDEKLQQASDEYYLQAKKDYDKALEDLESYWHSTEYFWRQGPPPGPPPPPVV